jgi:hypothetical protein
MAEDNADNHGLLAWCVVANVAVETFQGEGGLEVRQGLKHFAPGAKVWVLPPQWGDGGESVFVIGHHRGRGQGRLARMVVGRHHLSDFRVRGVYSPAVHRELIQPWKHKYWEDRSLRLWESREEAERAAEWWTIAQAAQAAQAGVRQPRRRGDLLDAVSALAEPRPWTPLPYLANRLATDLFGDPPDPAGAIGGLLRDQREADIVSMFLAPLHAIVNDLEPASSDIDYTSHRLWPEVVAAADRAHTALAQPPGSEEKA